MERYLFSTVSVRLLITTGAFRPLSVPALRRWAKNTRPLEKMFPLQRSGTIRMSAFPATGLSMPLWWAGRLVDGIVQSERTVNEIPVRETLPHRGGVYGASDLGVYDLYGGEHRDLRLLDTERVRERCGVFRDLDLRFQIRINVYGAVGDDEEPILLGDLENGRLAEQIAIFLQAFLLVQDGLHEGRGVHQPLHGHIRFAAVNELDGLVCGGCGRPLPQ